ncbi:MAG: class I SAM-dependent methyltransferase [Candidatus Moraniibacteriota bacterium]
MKHNQLLRAVIKNVKDIPSLVMGIKNKKNRILTDDIVDIVKQWADSGDNTDKCLKKGFLPVPVHFYQPIPDIEDLEKRKIWEKVSTLNGIKFEPNRYLEFIKLLGEKYSKECDWPNEPTSNPGDFYLNNNCFSYGCASALHSIIREFKPKKIIEIGSGNSSKIIRDALFINKKEEHVDCEHTVIDPYSTLDKNNFSENTNIIKEKVEEMNVDFFKQLGENDVLFIDSSHVCKIGSDVNFEILEVLPMLNKGVIIHFHDISLPYEYTKAYAINPKFRMFWTESYLLQSFLSCNNDFEIILPVNYVQKEFEKEFRNFFPNSNKAENFGSGSFWIKKIG